MNSKYTRVITIEDAFPATHCKTSVTFNILSDGKYEVNARLAYQNIASYSIFTGDNGTPTSFIIASDGGNESIEYKLSAGAGKTAVYILCENGKEKPEARFSIADILSSSPHFKFLDDHILRVRTEVQPVTIKGELGTPPR